MNCFVLQVFVNMEELFNSIYREEWWHIQDWRVSDFQVSMTDKTVAHTRLKYLYPKSRNEGSDEGVQM